MNARTTVVKVSYKCVSLQNCIFFKKTFAIANESIHSVYGCHEGDKNKAVTMWSQQTPDYVVL